MKSFKYAYDGLKEGILKGRNFRIQIFIAVIVLVTGFYLNFSYIELAILVITISSVLILELVNTSLEEIVNIVSPQKQEKARIAKDVSAGAVLISSIASVLVGALLFFTKI